MCNLNFVFSAKKEMADSESASIGIGLSLDGLIYIIRYGKLLF